jgi:rhodanese-related sulfurtransferase
MSVLKTIAPDRAAELLRSGAVLVDIRNSDERAREHIPGSAHRPLSGLEGGGPLGVEGQTVIFYCRTGMRTNTNAQRLAAATPCEAYIIEGGLEAWKRAGLPTNLNPHQPIEIMRQVQIAAGSLALLGVILGFALHPAFFALSGIVGAGLIFAGTTGNCMMAKLLALMPWNRAATKA